jgi:hypothetical protein
VSSAFKATNQVKFTFSPRPSQRIQGMAAELANSIQQAVLSALSPQSGNSAEAYSYLEQVKASPRETWTAALALFLDKQNVPSEARMFGLQVVDELLSKK